MSQKVLIDEPECIGCASCVEICPDVRNTLASGTSARQLASLIKPL